MSFPEDDNNWDSDIVFSQALLEQKLANNKRSNIHARYPDKDLADAFARLHGPDEYDDDDDDDETESTFISHHSDKLFVKERCDSLLIPGLDDYMLGSPCSGVVTRLGTHKQVLDDGDWDEDIKLPLKGLPDSPLARPPALESLYLHDEPPPPTPSPLQQKQQQKQQQQQQHVQHKQEQQPPQEPLTRKVRFLNMDQINTYTPMPQVDVHDHEGEVEEDDEEEGYDDIAFPDDMAGLAIKRPPSPTISPPQQQQQQQHQKQKQQQQQSPTLERNNGREDDDEDFCKDIQIDSDDVFSSKKKTKPRLSSIPRRIPESKLPMPSLDRQHPRFRAATHASRQRQAASNSPRGSAMAASSKRVTPEKSQQYYQQQQQQQQSRGSSHSYKSNGKTNSVNGTTLLFKPHTHVTYGNGSELDSLDILPDWRRRSLSCWKHLTEKRLGGIDPQRPWRHNMTRRKPTLIGPGDRALNKECNEMKYDAEKCRWQGNDKNVFSFASGSGSGSHENNSWRSSSSSSLSSKQQRRRPALITKMNKKSHASRNAEGIVGSMVFDPVEMRWEKSPNVENDDDFDDQDNALADIEDLGEFHGPTLYRDAQQQHQAHRQAPSLRVRLPNTTREFELSRPMKQLIQEQEEEHYERMKFWDLRKEDEDVFVPIDTPVRAFTYLLYQTPQH
ncbi:hypothetical protein BDB00DRAFT_928180 [Zychaea mexicana]|uniref:uncharacterized protein n=1 Tax=Zychaea mexicana TaxID=64656 RepID=UPI0022FE64DA|nr:uncharacterized protein BDB00DRAFT_928180 [Zychaea mexicana]KAI9494507.1 hypothetical protein BDB00DRAFT_928180 [Zychaea mexicana]